MQNKKVILGVLAVVVLAAGWYLFRPERLWVNKTVSESFSPTATVPAAVSPTTPAAAAPAQLASGAFHSGAHETRGTATIYGLADGKRVLRLTGFETSNGPDVQVYLVAAADAKDNETVTKAGFVPLGGLKGNLGDQNYDVPADVDLDRYRAVTIWCRRFGVNFGTAPLAPGSMLGAGESTKPMESSASVLFDGSFHGVAHETRGTATVYQLPDGKRVLRFAGFETSNGPDVQVYLVAAADAKDNDTVTKSGYVRLAALKGNQGDQNYDLPADLDL